MKISRLSADNLTVETGVSAIRTSAALLSFSVFRLIVLALCSVTVIFLLMYAVRYLPAVGDNTYPESAAILSAKQFSQGLGLYTDYHQAPYFVTAFPPLWYVVLAIPAWLGFTDLDTLTLIGRLVVFLALFGVATLAYFWNRQLGKPVQLAILAPALYLSVPILIPWALTARPDFPSLLCSFLAMYLVARKESAVAIMIGALAASIAFLIRHNAVAVPVTVVLWLLWSRRVRHAVLFCAVWGAAVGGIFALFQVWSHGLLLVNLSGAKFGRMAVTYGRDTILRLVVPPGHAMASILLAFGALGFVSNPLQRNAPASLMSIYLPVTFFFATLGSAAAGADVNHWLEPALALALLAPTGLGRIKDSWTRDAGVCQFATIVMLVLLLPSLDMQRWGVMHAKPADMSRLLPYAAHKQVFSDIPYLAARTAEPAALDMASLTYAVRSGNWSTAPLVDALDQKKYSLIILGQGGLSEYDPAALYPRYPHLDPSIQAAIRRNYSFCADVDGASLYSPQGISCP